MNKRLLALIFTVSLLSLGACGSSVQTDQQDELSEHQLNQILATKTPYAISKGETPVLNTYDWDSIFGGESGEELKYDNYGEIDELVFIAPKDTIFSLKRKIRRLTRTGDETIYYKVTTPDYTGSQDLWIDGRFFDLRDLEPKDIQEPNNAIKTLVKLRTFEGLPYTWHGSSAEGVPELLEYYPPKNPLSVRTQSDWMLKGMSSLGMLYLASGQQTPLDVAEVPRFGETVFIDLSNITDTEETPAIEKKAKTLQTILRPLDIIQFGERVMIVLDKDQLIEARYDSKFAGKVHISSLVDTVFGLLQKGVLVEDPLTQLDNRNLKKVFIRRYADTSGLGFREMEGSASNSENPNEEPSPERSSETDPEEQATAENSETPAEETETSPQEE